MVKDCATYFLLLTIFDSEIDDSSKRRYSNFLFSNLNAEIQEPDILFMYNFSIA